MRNFFVILLSLMLPLSFAACSDDDTPPTDNIYLYTTTANVDAVAGYISVTVATSGTWTASTQDSWLSVDPAGGNVTGHTAVHVTYQANESEEPRTGTVIFKAGNVTSTLSVNQKAKK